MSNDELPERCLLMCRDCLSDPVRVARCGDRLVVPFRTRADRASWSREHTRATGHRAWFCVDGWPSAAAARALLVEHDAFVAGLADRAIQLVKAAS